MQLISIVRDNVKIPVYVASDQVAAESALKSVALSCLNSYNEKEENITVICDKIFDEKPNENEYKNSILAYKKENVIEILKIVSYNKGFIFNNFVTECYSLELICNEEIPEFMILNSEVSEISKTNLTSIYPQIKKDSQEHTKFMTELMTAIKK